MTNDLMTSDNALRAIMTQTTPKSAVKTRKGRSGKTLSYVSHDWVTRQLNEAFNWQWSFDVLDEMLFPNKEEPKQIVVKGQLTVHNDGVEIIKTQFGGSDVKRFKTGELMDLGADFKAASSDALKKCASLLGLALDLYGSTPVQPQPTINQETGEVLEHKPINGKGKVADDPMSQFWSNVRDLGWTTETGQNFLAQHDGPEAAISALVTTAA